MGGEKSICERILLLLAPHLDDEMKQPTACGPLERWTALAHAHGQLLRVAPTRKRRGKDEEVRVWPLAASSLIDFPRLAREPSGAHLHTINPFISAPLARRHE